MALLHQSRAPPPLPFLRRHRSRPSQQSNLSQISHIHRRRASLRCSASSSSDPPSPAVEDLVELSLFPLPLVLFPGAVLPLQIFKFRYRILMHTLLHTDLRFGVVFSDSGAGNIADVGCVGEVVKHERLVDDRFFLICKGQEWFRVSRVIRTKPYLIAVVAWLEDRPPPDPADGDDLDALAVAFDLPLPKTESLIKPMPTPLPVSSPPTLCPRSSIAVTSLAARPPSTSSSASPGSSFPSVVSEISTQRRPSPSRAPSSSSSPSPASPLLTLVASGSATPTSELT